MLEVTYTFERISSEEFWNFIESVEDGNRRFELVDGVIIEMPTASPLHVYISSLILTLLFTFAHSQKLGFSFGDSCSYELSEGYTLIPDVSFVSKSRLSMPFPKKFSFAPDLAVEVISPSNTYREIHSKIEAYLTHGTQLVWIVYPEDKVVDVWRAMPDGSLNKRAFGMNDTLSGENVLPNFTLPIRDIFSEESLLG